MYVVELLDLEYGRQLPLCYIYIQVNAIINSSHLLGRGIAYFDNITPCDANSANS